MPTSQAQKVFGLNDVFNQIIILRPFDEDADFPWWVLSSKNQVLAVIETIKPDNNEVLPNIVLDAQYLGGNDLKIAVPAGSSKLNCQN